MKKLLFIGLLLTLFASYLAFRVHAQTSIMPDSPKVPVVTMQVWAKSWKEQDCGKLFAHATEARESSERESSKNNAYATNVVMMDMAAFWGCVEINKQVKP